MDRRQLEALIAQDLSVRQIAQRLAVTQPTVREWLKRTGLKTERAKRMQLSRGARKAGLPSVTMRCPHHGVTAHVPRNEGGYRCLVCRSTAVLKRRRKIKEIIVCEAGGRCVLCGYDRCLTALHFHHRDASEKSFGIARGGEARSIARARAEAAKCVLLCSNCHAEVESGVASLAKTI